MLHGTGNAVPNGPPHNQPESDSESYTGSSGSYSATASEHGQQQQQQQPATTQQTASKSQRYDSARAAQQASPAATHAAHPQRFEEEADGERKGNGARGKDKARQMVSAALNAPAARMRAVTASLAGRDSQRVTVYVFLVVSLLHLLFVILSCVLSQVDMQGGGCYTYWGFKAKCDDVSYTRRTALIKDCGQLRSSLQTGAAFSIMSILTSTAMVVVAWMMCGRLRYANYVARRQHRYQNVDASAAEADEGHGEGGAKAPAFNPGQLKLVTIILVAISLVFELIAWAVIAGVNTQRYCDDLYNFSTLGTYGVGFGLGLTAWIIEILAYVVYITVV